MQADSLEVECSNKDCPELNCPLEQQERPDALACCKVSKLCTNAFPHFSYFYLFALLYPYVLYLTVGVQAKLPLFWDGGRS